MKLADIGPLVRTPEEMEESSIHWPYTKVGTVLLFVCSFAALIISLLAINLCEATGACSRDSWNEDFWGVAGFGSPWCEKAKPDKMMGQTFNSQSNLGIMLVGTIVMFIAVADFYRIYFINAGTRRNHIVNCPVLRICGFELCAVGLGSFAYHSHSTNFTGFLDLGLMCVLLLYLGFYGLLFFIDVNAHWILLNFMRLVIIVVPMGLGGWLGEESRVHRIDLFVAVPGMLGALAGMILLAMIARLVPVTRRFMFPSEQVFWRFRAPHFSLISGVTGTVGFLCQEQAIDLPCDPVGIWQFHAIWHVMVACSLGSIYMFHRSEYIGFEDDDLSRFEVDEDSGCYDKVLDFFSVSPPKGNKLKIDL